MWFRKLDIPSSLLDEYVCKSQGEKGANPVQCNNDKTKVYTCLVKCKTIGILILATTCGIVLGIRELYGGESPTQAANFYLDVCDHYVGK